MERRRTHRRRGLVGRDGTGTRLGTLPPCTKPRLPHLHFLNANASTKIPVLNYRYPIYEDGSPHSHQLHASTLLRAEGRHVLVSTKPSIERRLVPLPFCPLSTVLLARVRCSRINKVSSLHNFYVFNSLSVCTSRRAAATLHQRLPCYFTSELCPKIPLLHLRRIVTGRPFFINGARIVPVRIVRKRVPVLKFQFNGLTCVASVGSVDPRRVPCLTKISALIMGTLQ